jgi:hypothetical protein
LAKIGARSCFAGAPNVRSKTGGRNEWSGGAAAGYAKGFSAIDVDGTSRRRARSCNIKGDCSMIRLLIATAAVALAAGAAGPAVAQAAQQEASGPRQIIHDYRVDRREDRNEFRRDRREDRGELRGDLREDRRDLREGEITRHQFAQDRRKDLKEFRHDRREDRGEFRRDRREDRRELRHDLGGFRHGR